MAEHTPTTETVRDCFVDGAAGDFIEEDFDRWLAAHDAELRAEVERLRARIGAAQRLLSIFERDGDSNPYDDLRTLLAGSGEQPGKGERAWLNADPRKAAENLRAVVGASEQPGEVYGPRPAACCGKCPPIEGGGYDCTCEGNPRCVRERVKGALHEHDCTPDGPPHLAREWAALSTQERAEAFAWFTRPLAVVGQGVTGERTITLPRPVVPHGPVGQAENEATANYLWEAARRIGDSRMFGSNLTRTVSDLLAAASHAVREDKPVDDGRPAAVRPSGQEGS